MTQTNVTCHYQLEDLQVGRVRQLTDTPSTDYRRDGPSIPPPRGGGDDPPGRRPDGGRGDGDKPDRLELLADNLTIAAALLAIFAFLLRLSCAR